MHLAPGDPASVIAGPDASADDVRRLERQLGLDAPLPVQLVRWYGRLVRGDLGNSIFLRKPVTEAIIDRVEPTLLLTLFATLISSVGSTRSMMASVTGLRRKMELPRSPRTRRPYQRTSCTGIGASSPSWREIFFTSSA